MDFISMETMENFNICDEILLMDPLSISIIEKNRTTIIDKFTSYLNKKKRLNCDQWISTDISRLFHYYDKIFFSSYIRKELGDRNIELEFKYTDFGKCDTRSAYCEIPTGSSTHNCSYLIVINATIFKKLFESELPKVYNNQGIKCNNVIQFLAVTLEHEMFHLIIQVFRPDILISPSGSVLTSLQKSRSDDVSRNSHNSDDKTRIESLRPRKNKTLIEIYPKRQNVHGKEFKTMVKNVFRHTTCNYQLIID